MTKSEISVGEISTNSSQQKKDRKERQRSRQKKKEKMKPLTKVVIRHLPPTMGEEEFLKQIELPDHDFFYYANADWSLGNCATCRAYVTLKCYDDVFLFRDRFDGYVFVDSKGAEYAAIVEFAPFQGLLKNRSRRSDNKTNTIEEEAHYQQFLVKLQEEREAVVKGSDIKLEFSLDRKKEDITSTPLLQYLANKKEKRREEAKKRSEEKRRQREEEKSRRQTQQQQPQVTKIMIGQSNSKAGAAIGASGSAGSAINNRKDGNNVNATGERKNSRAKRKAEREQRRKEQREKALGASADDKAAAQQSETKTQADEKLTRESKKYSEKRERERERNRNRKEKEKEKEKDKKKSKPGVSIANSTNASGAEDVAAKQKSKDEQISDSVLNFIRSVASVKEFVPKHKQESEDQEKAGDERNNEDVDVEVPQTLNESKLQTKISNDKEKSKELQEKKDSASGTTEASNSRREDIEKQRREERRIRNKDRPSIAIYQPKPRQRVSEESDSNAGNCKDVRSNPDSDCESIKKDDFNGRKKKISRYSERRSERRTANTANKSKSNETTEDLSKILRKSSSTEEPSKSDVFVEEGVGQFNSTEIAESQDP